MTLNGAAYKWNSIDLSSYITGNGTYAFAITTTSATQVKFISKESTSNQPASLTITWTAPNHHNNQLYNDDHCTYNWHHFTERDGRHVFCECGA
jgi:hypothetical protein